MQDIFLLFLDKIHDETKDRVDSVYKELVLVQSSIHLNFVGTDTKRCPILPVVVAIKVIVESFRHQEHEIIAYYEQNEDEKACPEGSR